MNPGSDPGSLVGIYYLGTTCLIDPHNNFLMICPNRLTRVFDLSRNETHRTRQSDREHQVTLGKHYFIR